MGVTTRDCRVVFLCVEGVPRRGKMYLGQSARQIRRTEPRVHEPAGQTGQTPPPSSQIPFDSVNLR